VRGSGVQATRLDNCQEPGFPGRFMFKKIAEIFGASDDVRSRGVGLTHSVPLISTRDFALLEWMASTELDAMSAAPVLAVLERSRVVPPDQLGPETIRIGSRVTIDADSGPPFEVRLVPPDQPRNLGDLAVTSALGLALLGRQEGDVVIARLPGRDAAATVMIHAVHAP
jgi:hypothetical protein